MLVSFKSCSTIDKFKEIHPNEFQHPVMFVQISELQKSLCLVAVISSLVWRQFSVCAPSTSNFWGLSEPILKPFSLVGAELLARVWKSVYLWYLSHFVFCPVFGSGFNSSPLFGFPAIPDCLLCVLTLLTSNLFLCLPRVLVSCLPLWWVGPFYICVFCI